MGHQFTNCRQQPSSNSTSCACSLAERHTISVLSIARSDVFPGSAFLCRQKLTLRSSAWTWINTDSDKSGEVLGRTKHVTQGWLDSSERNELHTSIEKIIQEPSASLSQLSVEKPHAWIFRPCSSNAPGLDCIATSVAYGIRYVPGVGHTYGHCVFAVVTHAEIHSAIHQRSSYWSLVSSPYSSLYWSSPPLPTTCVCVPTASSSLRATLNILWKYVFHHYIDYRAYVFQGMVVNAPDRIRGTAPADGICICPKRFVSRTLRLLVCLLACLRDEGQNAAATGCAAAHINACTQGT